MFQIIKFEKNDIIFDHVITFIRLQSPHIKDDSVGRGISTSRAADVSTTWSDQVSHSGFDFFLVRSLCNFPGFYPRDQSQCSLRAKKLRSRSVLHQTSHLQPSREQNNGLQ